MILSHLDQRYTRNIIRGGYYKTSKVATEVKITLNYREMIYTLVSALSTAEVRRCSSLPGSSDDTNFSMGKKINAGRCHITYMISYDVIEWSYYYYMFI